MEEDLLMHLLATFPTETRNTPRLSRPENQDPDGHLVIRGSRVPFTSPVGQAAAAPAASQSSPAWR